MAQVGFKLLALSALIVVFSGEWAYSAEPNGPGVRLDAAPDGYQVSVARVAMRDGVELETLIMRPLDSSVSYPLLLERMPFTGWDDPDKLGKHLQARLNGRWQELSWDGYIFVLQHIRGRFNSGGDYVMYRGGRDQNDPQAVDDSTDAFDTIEWLLRHVPGHNGRVGIIGISNAGSLAAMALIDAHPALRAASPQGPAIFQFTGDDFIHNGAFSLSPIYAYSQWTYWLPGGPEKLTDEVGYDHADHYEFFLRLGPLRNVNEKFFKGKFPLWNELISHPDFDEYWRSRAFDHLIERTNIPTLSVGGYYDTEDQKGPFGVFDTLKRHDEAGVVRLVVGPWLHGSWSSAEYEGGRRIGPLDFGSATADVYRAMIEAPFFAHYLKDKGPAPSGSAVMFQTGTNRWITHDRYPPATATLRKLYFRENNALSFTPPASTGGFSQYVHDPRHPVPHAPRPIPDYFSKEGQLWRVKDQRFAYLRPDTVYFQTEILQEDVTITGEVVASLFASTSGTDADWVVKLIDVYPQDLKDPDSDRPAPMAGYHYLVTAEVMRAKYQNDLSNPKPIEPGAVLPYRFSLLSRDHVFKKGHRILVQVQSSWFPMFDLNPGTFVNIPDASEGDFQRTTQRIYHTSEYPSSIDLHLLSLRKD